MNKSPDFRNTLMEALGMKILPMQNGKYYASMPVDHRTVQIQGCLHGGASIALAETLITAGNLSPAILYMLGIINNKPCEAVKVVVNAPAVKEP